MFYPFLSPHPWISVSARMEQCSPGQAPLSSLCSDLRAQPLALPNVYKHKFCTGLQNNSVLTFSLEFKPSCYLLSVFRSKQQYPFLVCWPATACPAFLAIPNITKNHFQGCWPSARVNFCCPYTAPSSQVPEGQQSAVSLFANWKSTSFFFLSAPLIDTHKQEDEEIQVPAQREAFLCVQQAPDQASSQAVITWKERAVVIFGASTGQRIIHKC